MVRSLQEVDHESRLRQLVCDYRKKRDDFNQTLSHELGDIAQWSIPPGGLFYWLKLHSGLKLNLAQLLTDAIDNNVAFMPGAPFFPTFSNEQDEYGEPDQFIRLNFSNATRNEAERGLSVLANLIRNS